MDLRLILSILRLSCLETFRPVHGEGGPAFLTLDFGERRLLGLMFGGGGRVLGAGTIGTALGGAGSLGRVLGAGTLTTELGEGGSLDRVLGAGTLGTAFGGGGSLGRVLGAGTLATELGGGGSLDRVLGAGTLSTAFGGGGSEEESVFSGEELLDSLSDFEEELLSPALG